MFKKIIDEKKKMFGIIENKINKIIMHHAAYN